MLGRRCSYCGTDKTLMFDFRELGQGSTVPVWRWSDRRFLECVTRMEVVCRMCYRAKREGRAGEPIYARAELAGVGNLETS